LVNRITAFEQKFNIGQFIFETPFTVGGAAQTDDISEQYKRKTILQVDGKFPYIKKRLKVVSKKRIILSPIQNALEIIESRNTALLTELNCNPPNIKTLQNVLQGSVLARVNQGPIKITEVFIGTGKYPPEETKKTSRIY